MQSERSKTYNRYDVYLFLIIVSAIYRNYGIIHPSSFLSVIFFPQLLRNSRILRLNNIRSLAAFLLFWLSYALISFTWGPDRHEVVLDTTLLFLNSMLFLEIIVFSLKAKRPLQTLAFAWVCAFLITSVVAVWEINTDHHLNSAKEMKDFRKDALGETMDKDYAVFTFYNPNTYAYYICLAFPIVLYLFFQSKKRLDHIRYLVPVILIIYIMSKNSSRGGLLTLAITLSTFLYFKMKGSSFRGKVYIIMCIVLLGLFLALYGEIIFQALLFRLSKNDLFEDNARIVIWLASWRGFLDSYGFGQGAGSMIPVLEASKELPFEIYYSHNMIMELLLEYGMLITIGILLFLYRLFVLGIRINDSNIKSMVVGTILAFPFYSVINSENINLTFLWMFFATIYVFCINSVPNPQKNKYIMKKNNIPDLSKVKGI